MPKPERNKETVSIVDIEPIKDAPFLPFLQRKIEPSPSHNPRKKCQRKFMSSVNMGHRAEKDLLGARPKSIKEDLIFLDEIDKTDLSSRKGLGRL